MVDVYEFKTSCHKICGRYCYLVWGEMIDLEKENKKVSGKDKC